MGVPKSSALPQTKVSIDMRRFRMRSRTWTIPISIRQLMGNLYDRGHTGQCDYLYVDNDHVCKELSRIFISVICFLSIKKAYLSMSSSTSNAFNSGIIALKVLLAMNIWPILLTAYSLKHNDWSLLPKGLLLLASQACVYSYFVWAIYMDAKENVSRFTRVVCGLLVSSIMWGIVALFVFNLPALNSYA